MQIREVKLDEVMGALASIRCGAALEESDLHALAAKAFADAEIEARHEVRLGPGCRIDFMAGEIGVEIKKGRPERTKLIAQLARYAACDCIRELVVVVPRSVNIPKEIGSKRITVVALERLWGMWLP